MLVSFRTVELLPATAQFAQILVGKLEKELIVA